MDNWQVLAAYRASLRARSLSETSIAGINKVLTRFAYDVPVKLVDVDRSNVDRWLAHLRVSPATRRVYLSRIAGFYRWALDEGHVDDDPTRKIPRPRVGRGLPRPIARQDLEVAIRLADPRMRAWLLLAALCGLRCSEIAGIQVDDLLLELTPPLLLVTHAKGRRQRTVPLHPDALSAIYGAGKPRAGYLFCYWNDPGQPISGAHLSRAANRYLHSMGIAATMHQLRHFYVSEVYRLSGDLRMAQELAGHQSPATTAVYAAWNKEGSAKVVEQITYTSRRFDLRADQERRRIHRAEHCYPGDPMRLSQA